MRADRRLAAIVAAAGLLALAVGVGAAVTHAEPRMAGSNQLAFHAPIALPAGERICQTDEVVYADAARLRVWAPVGGPHPPLAVRVQDEGRVLASGRVPGGWTDGTAEVPLEPEVERTLVADLVCVQNTGDEEVQLGGAPGTGVDGATIGDEPAPGRIRLEYLRPGEESWLELLPAVTHRFALGKGDAVGAWTLPVAALLLLAACALAVRLAVRGDVR